MLSKTQSYFLFHVLSIIYFIIPIVRGIVNYEYFEAPLSECVGGKLCSAEIADDSFSVPSRVLCATACTQNPLCMEFNFRVDTKSCELYYCRASHLLQTTANCANYQRRTHRARSRDPELSIGMLNAAVGGRDILGPCEKLQDSQKLRSGIYGSGCVNQLMLPEKCSFPFTLNGIRYYNCASSPSSGTHEYGCYDDSHKWKRCGLPIDYAVSEKSTDITIPTFAGVTTVMSVNNWIIFHRRVYETLQYNRPWSAYKAGFGAWNSDYWLGLEKAYQMTTQETWRLRFEMEILSTGEWVSVEYDTFRLDSEALFYTLYVSTAFFGDIHDLLRQHDGMAFTTYDADHDNWANGVCGSNTGNNGFWFNNCFTVCLTCAANYYQFATISGIPTLSRSNMMMKRV